MTRDHFNIFSSTSTDSTSTMPSRLAGLKTSRAISINTTAEIAHSDTQSNMLNHSRFGRNPFTGYFTFPPIPALVGPKRIVSTDYICGFRLIRTWSLVKAPRR